MSKQYKLLKNYITPHKHIYPGVIKTTNEWLSIFNDINCFDFEIKKDWFEEVKEKEFEILAFRLNKDDKHRRYKNIHGFFYYWDGTINHKNRCNELSEDFLLSDSHYEIYSVRRILDNEVFTLEDKVYSGIKNSIGMPYIIDNFYIRENDGILLVRSKDNLIVETITTIQHSSKSIFKDFLGNELFEGDMYYFIRINNTIINSNIAQKGKEHGENTSEFIYFKNRPDCVNHIDQNKPIYSKKQVLDALNVSDIYYTTSGRFINEHVFRLKLGL